MAVSPERDPSSGSGMKFYWIGSGVVLCLALAYLGWVFFSRWQTTHQLEERAAAEKRALDQKTFEGMGGERFEILSFYASPGVVKRGDATTLCYSVSNAKSVTLEPQSNPVWPSFSRCVNVTPAKTTTYTLTATDASGHTKSSELVVEVR
jgi:hypothetical protein